jgi:hypothetical protein
MTRGAASGREATISLPQASRSLEQRPEVASARQASIKRIIKKGIFGVEPTALPNGRPRPWNSHLRQPIRR